MYIVSYRLVYTQYLALRRRLGKDLSSSQNVKTVNKSPDLFAGFEIFEVFSETEVRTRF